jgi:hypothetical protein
MGGGDRELHGRLEGGDGVGRHPLVSAGRVGDHRPDHRAAGMQAAQLSGLGYRAQRRRRGRAPDLRDFPVVIMPLTQVSTGIVKGSWHLPPAPPHAAAPRRDPSRARMR